LLSSLLRIFYGCEKVQTLCDEQNPSAVLRHQPGFFALSRQHAHASIWWCRRCASGIGPNLKHPPFPLAPTHWPWTSLRSSRWIDPNSTALRTILGYECRAKSRRALCARWCASCYKTLAIDMEPRNVTDQSMQVSSTAATDSSSTSSSASSSDTPASSGSSSAATTSTTVLAMLDGLTPEMKAALSQFIWR